MEKFLLIIGVIVFVPVTAMAECATNSSPGDAPESSIGPTGGVTGAATGTGNLATASTQGHSKSSECYAKKSTDEKHEYESSKSEGSPKPELLKDATSDFQQSHAEGRAARMSAREALMEYETASLLQSQNAKAVASEEEMQQLRDIANGQQGPYAMQAESEFASIGVSAPPEDPLPPVGIPDITPVSNGGSSANALNPSGHPVTTSSTTVINNSKTTTQYMAAVSPSAAQAQGASGLSVNSAGFITGPGSLTAKKPEDDPKLKANPDANSSGAAQKQTLADKQKALDLNRAKVMQQMGLASSRSPASIIPQVQDPIRAKTEDIFEVMHTHYASLRDRGHFFEMHLPLGEPEDTKADVQDDKRNSDQNRALIRKQMPATKPQTPFFVGS